MCHHGQFEYIDSYCAKTPILRAAWREPPFLLACLGACLSNVPAFTYKYLYIIAPPSFGNIYRLGKTNGGFQLEVIRYLGRLGSSTKYVKDLIPR